MKVKVKQMPGGHVISCGDTFVAFRLPPKKQRTLEWRIKSAKFAAHCLYRKLHPPPPTPVPTISFRQRRDAWEGELAVFSEQVGKAYQEFLTK